MHSTDAQASSRDLQDVLQGLSSQLFDNLAEAASRASASVREGGGVYFFGNGGSAATAEHLASELVGRFASERPPMRAGVLTSSGTLLTALANDYPGDELFARQVRGLLSRRDTLVALSASGRSPNILRALDEGVQIGCARIGFTGTASADFAARCDWVLAVPATSVPRIQEVHLMLGHIFCELIETYVTQAS
jgi:D-sedoheptulose 7-phosphate isomerase